MLMLGKVIDDVLLLRINSPRLVCFPHRTVEADRGYIMSLEETLTARKMFPKEKRLEPSRGR
jgi:hypothetical protein